MRTRRKSSAEVNVPTNTSPGSGLEHLILIFSTRQERGAFCTHHFPAWGELILFKPVLVCCWALEMPREGGTLLRAVQFGQSPAHPTARLAEILNYFLELLFANNWREILNNFIRVQGTTEASALYRINKALPIFCPPFVCMDHTPCK